MKTRKFFGFLMILASGFLFLNCTSDPIPGPPGQDGVDGVDGVDGQDGVSGTASCVACHNNTTRDAVAAGFAVSLHAIGETWEERGFYFGRTSCSKCHSGLGYEQFIETGEIIGSPDLEVPLSCNSCHSSHETFDFENDGPDYALRNTGPTSLDLASSINLDFGDASNNCITCHQPRNSYEIPTLNSDGTYVVTSVRFGPHHSPQSTMLEGILGAEITFEGSEAYPAPGTAGHRTGSSCVQCHMGDSDDPELGGHSWNVFDDTCVRCHPPLEEATGVTDDMATLLALLQQVEGEGFDEDADGNITPNGEVVIGIIQPGSESSTNPGIFSDVAAMAAWNYKTIYEDQSKGIHNPEYTKALLKNSIQALQNEN
jgi:hypothetical protein